MRQDQEAFVYMMANASNSVLYVGVTSDLGRRVAEHKRHAVPGFTDRYNVTKLVYFERSGSIDDAIAREKQLKGWRREKKDRLVNAMNPEWRDLAG